MRPLSTLPFLCSSRQYAAAWRQRLKVPFRCTAMTESKSSSLMLKSMRSRRMPALFTTTCSAPHLSIAAWIMRWAAL